MEGRGAGNLPITPFSGTQLQMVEIRLSEKPIRPKDEKRVCEDSSRLAREKTGTPIAVIALIPPVPFYLGKVKSPTSVLTRSF